jgi:hypothetical protein
MTLCARVEPEELLPVLLSLVGAAADNDARGGLLGVGK